MRELLELLNGKLAAKLLHNRGRARAVAVSLLAPAARKRLARLKSGRWEPCGKTVDTVVSLTSWTPRLATLPLILTGLLAQTRRPRSILVWLTKEDLLRISGESLEIFRAWGVGFQEAPDFGPHKKWLPLLKQGVKDAFVMCDDDVFYPENWLEGLLRENRLDAYVGTRCHQIVLGANGRIASYEHWKRQVAWTGNAAHDLFITGIGGAIIYPERIGKEFRDWKRISAHCPQADDIWLKAAHVEAGIPCYKTKFSFPCLEVPESQKSALLSANVDRGGNDRQMGPLQLSFRRFQRK